MVGGKPPHRRFGELSTPSGSATLTADGTAHAIAGRRTRGGVGDWVSICRAAWAGCWPRAGSGGVVCRPELGPCAGCNMGVRAACADGHLVGDTCCGTRSYRAHSTGSAWGPGDRYARRDSCAVCKRRDLSFRRRRVACIRARTHRHVFTLCFVVGAARRHLTAARIDCRDACHCRDERVCQQLGNYCHHVAAGGGARRACTRRCNG